MVRLGSALVMAMILAMILATTAEAAVNHAECTCRAPGRTFGLGEKACLSGPGGWRIATCVMAANNTSWQFEDVPCTVSQRRTRHLA